MLYSLHMSLAAILTIARMGNQQFVLILSSQVAVIEVLKAAARPVWCGLAAAA
jgi:hypothetical protein